MCQTKEFDGKKKLEDLIKNCSEILDEGIIGNPEYKRLQRPTVVLFWGFSDKEASRISAGIRGLWSNDDEAIIYRNVNSYGDIDTEEIEALSERKDYPIGYNDKFLFICLVSETAVGEYEKFLADIDNMKSRIGATGALILTMYFGSNKNEEQISVFKRNVKKLSEYNKDSAVICLGNKTDGGRIIDRNQIYSIAVPLVATVSAVDNGFRNFVFSSKDKGIVISAASASMSKESRLISMAVLKNLLEKATAGDNNGGQEILQKFVLDWYEKHIRIELPEANCFSMLPEEDDTDKDDSFGIREAFVNRYFEEKVIDIVEMNKDNLKEDLKNEIKAAFPYNQILKMTDGFNIECSSQGNNTSYKGALEKAEYVFKKQLNNIIKEYIAGELRQEAETYSANLNELKDLLGRKLVGIDQNKVGYIDYFGSCSIYNSLIAESKTLSDNITEHLEEVFTKIIEADEDIYKGDLVNDLKKIMGEHLAKIKICEALNIPDHIMDLNRRTKINNGGSNRKSLYIINDNKDIEDAITGEDSNSTVDFFHIGKGNRIEKLTLYEFDAEDIM